MLVGFCFGVSSGGSVVVRWWLVFWVAVFFGNFGGDFGEGGMVEGGVGSLERKRKRRKRIKIFILFNVVVYIILMN